MNKIQKNIYLLAVATTFSLPVLASSIDVHVVGTITPSACVPALSDGGVVDYGVIRADSLNTDDYTKLPEKQLDFTITCKERTQIAITAINGRPNSLAGATESGYHHAGKLPVNMSAGSEGVGLGLDGDSKIGGYAVRAVNYTAKADGENVQNIQRRGSNNWGSSNASLYTISTSVPLYSAWSATIYPHVVASFRYLSFKLGVQAYINKTSELDLSKPITLDGLTTIELVYL